MKRIISLVLSVILAVSYCTVFGYAEKKTDRIDLTVWSDIGGISTSNADYIYRIDTEGFYKASTPLQAYFENHLENSFIEGVKYQLELNIYCEGEMKTADNFGIYVNREKLNRDDYSIEYNSVYNQTFLTVKYDVTVDYRIVYKDPLNYEIIVPDNQTVGWKNKAKISAAVKSLSSELNCYLAWYENDKMVGVSKLKYDYNVGGVTYTKVYVSEPFITEPLTSSHTYTAKFVIYDSDLDEYHIVSQHRQEKTITIDVKSGFFDKILYFFQLIFGKDTVDVKVDYAITDRLINP